MRVPGKRLQGVGPGFRVFSVLDSMQGLAS